MRERLLKAFILRQRKDIIDYSTVPLSFTKHIVFLPLIIQYHERSVSCTITPELRGVMITLYCEPELSSLFVQSSRRHQWESVAEDVCGGKGCVTGLVPENLSQPLLSWAAETPPEGQDTHYSLYLHLAFHMSQPSLSSPPGWRKKRKRMLCYSSYCFISPQVRFCLSFFYADCPCG